MKSKRIGSWYTIALWAFIVLALGAWTNILDGYFAPDRLVHPLSLLNWVDAAFFSAGVVTLWWARRSE